MRDKKVTKNTKTQERALSGSESDVYGERLSNRNVKLIEDEKPYMTYEELHTGDLRITIMIPPFNLDELQRGYKQKLTLFLEQNTLRAMKEKFAGHNEIKVFIDGACSGNPGSAAAGACFFSTKKKYDKYTE